MEKFIVLLTVLTVLLATGAVVVGTLLPFRTGISRGVIDSELSMMRFFGQNLTPAAPIRGDGAPIALPAAAGPAPVGSAPGRRQPQPPPRARAENFARVAFTSNYFAREGSFGTRDQVSGIPWLRREPDVIYYPPRPVPRSLVQRYQAVESAVELMRESKGFFKEEAGGQTFTISKVDRSSYLSSVVGLQPGDKILSVNGHKIEGVGIGAAKAIYNEIRNETKFAVKIERGGRIQVLTFSIRG